jgi:crotonobetainyl-CoA:carnitine CoA-transferase CaiB-like acyl-CoA transferase
MNDMKEAAPYPPAADAPGSASAKKGLRIVDFSTHLSGPIASHLLMEMGATVIKIENPRTGDGNRGAFEVTNGVGLMHLALNSGTRSLAVDRHSKEWPQVVEACARWADAAVVGSRPVDARRRGMDFLTMQQANPDIIYCSISGFGDEGPWKDHTAHGQTIDSFAGLVPTVMGEFQPQTLGGWRTSGTTLGGVFAALGILNALLRRARGEARAQYLSVSLWQAAMWWSWRDLTMLANTGAPWLDYSDLGSRYSLYATSDDRVLLVAPVEQKFWHAFCDLIGLGTDYRSSGTWGLSGMEFGVGDTFTEERKRIAAAIGQRPLSEWTALLKNTDIPFAPVLTLGEAMASEHAAVNGLMRTTSVAGREFEIPASPIRTADGCETLTRPGSLSSPPDIGEQSLEVLRELGLEDLARAES